MWSGYCLSEYAVSQSLLLVILSLARIWSIQGRLEIHIFTIGDLPVVSIVYCIVRASWPLYCCIIMAIIWQESRHTDAFKTLGRMQWTNIMAIITKTITTNGSYKMLQVQEPQLPNTSQKNKSHRSWRANLEGQVALSLRQCIAYSTMTVSSIQEVLAAARAPPWLANNE